MPGELPLLSRTTPLLGSEPRWQCPPSRGPWCGFASRDRGGAAATAVRAAHPLNWVQRWREGACPDGTGQGVLLHSPAPLPTVRPGSRFREHRPKARLAGDSGGEGSCCPQPLPPLGSQAVPALLCPVCSGRLGAWGPRQGRGCAIWEASGSRDPTRNRGRADLLGARTGEAGHGVTPSPVCRNGGHAGSGGLH